MQYYSYLELDQPAIKSEDEILADYWPYWEKAMIAKFCEGHELITKQNCIDDWALVNWAFLVDTN